MKKVIITLNEETSRFEATDIDKFIHYTAAKKADLKTSLKRSKKHEFEIVEAFEAVKPVKDETPKPTEPKEVKTSKPKKAKYQDYKEYITTNFLSEDLYSKSPKIADFCKEFDLKLNKASRNLSFEKVLDLMMVEGLIEYREPQKGKYKKLSFKYTDQHEAAMSPDEEEL